MHRTQLAHDAPDVGGIAGDLRHRHRQHAARRTRRRQVLFIVSVGLSVTMGLMGFVNLAHGAFAMLGGYVIVLAMNRCGIGFVPALALGFVVTAALSVVLERLLYRRLYRAGELDQVLFTIGLVFIFIAGGDARRSARKARRSSCRRRCKASSISASCTIAPTACS